MQVLLRAAGLVACAVSLAACTASRLDDESTQPVAAWDDLLQGGPRPQAESADYGTPPAAVPVQPASVFDGSAAPTERGPLAASATVPANDPPALRAPARVYEPVRPGSSMQQVESGGQRRSFGLHVPLGYDPQRALPLVIVLHARGSSAQSARLLGFNQQAEAAGFVVAYPEALGQPRLWNAGPDASPRRADDVAFVHAMIDAIGRGLNVDPDRIYAVGHSSGGAMAYRLAAEPNARVAGIVTVGATASSRDMRMLRTRLESAAAAGASRAVSVLHVHGRQDRTVPYDGGKSITLAGEDYLAARESVALWRAANRCTGALQAMRTAHLEREVHGPCAGGTAVELITVPQGGHEWPRALRPDAKSVMTMPELAWAFLSAHPKQ